MGKQEISLEERIFMSSLVGSQWYGQFWKVTWPRDVEQNSSSIAENFGTTIMLA